MDDTPTPRSCVSSTTTCSSSLLPLLLGLALSLRTVDAAQPDPDEDWPSYGGGPSGQHYSPRAQITASNISRLTVVWTFHTGALKQPGRTNQRSNFEATPILWHGRLYLDTPYDEVFALDAISGKRIWSYDPKVDHDLPLGIVASRGVALWHGVAAGKTACARDRVFVATLDRRLIALDAASGNVCADFGDAGVVDLAAGLHLVDTRWYSFTSPPTVVDDVVVIGSSVADNQLIEAPSGMIRGFNAMTGKLIWSFEPLQPAPGQTIKSGSGGAWSVISADRSLGLVFVPTGSPSVDFYGVNRPGDDRDANSVVALDVHTGRRVWGFQVVHHDLWDFDVASQPLLFSFRDTPAIAVTTKMGMTFVLDRRSGLPLYPVEERVVPPSTIAGEMTSPTQPFSSLPLMAPMTIDPGSLQGVNDAHTQFCRKKLASLVNDGAYTPVGLQPTLLYPGSTGGVNWGSAAFDPNTGVLYANVNSLAYETRLVPRESPPSPITWQSTAMQWILDAKHYWSEFLPAQTAAPPQPSFLPPDSRGFELSTQYGTPYKIFRAPLLAPDGLPCSPQPWGAVVALNLNDGKLLWRKPLGTLVPGLKTGAVTVGGPLVTRGGVLFTGGGDAPVLYGFDSASGLEIWRGALPAAAQSTPMSYQIDGRQYVVVAAGGHGSVAPKLDDAVVAFALP